MDKATEKKEVTLLLILKCRSIHRSLIPTKKKKNVNWELYLLCLFAHNI